MMKTNAIVVCVVSLLMLSDSLYSETIRLASGQTFVGEIISDDGEYITINVAGSKIPILKSLIQSRSESSGNLNERNVSANGSVYSQLGIESYLQYYPSGSVVCSTGVAYYDPRSGNKFTLVSGKMPQAYRNNDVKQPGYFEGVFKSYYENGRIRESGKYSHGLAVGEWSSYLSDGRPAVRGPFSDGVKEGTWCIWSYDDKYLRQECTFAAGIKKGPIAAYYPNGAIGVKGEFGNKSSLPGYVTDYYSDGTVKTSNMEYKRGLWTHWNSDGNKTDEETFSDTGRFIAHHVYFPTGIRKISAYYNVLGNKLDSLRIWNTQGKQVFHAPDTSTLCKNGFCASISISGKLSYTLFPKSFGISFVCNTQNQETGKIAQYQLIVSLDDSCKIALLSPYSVDDKELYPKFNWNRDTKTLEAYMGLKKEIPVERTESYNVICLSAMLAYLCETK